MEFIKHNYENRYSILSFASVSALENDLKPVIYKCNHCNLIRTQEVAQQVDCPQCGNKAASK